MADESGKGVKEGGYDLGGGEDGDEDSDDDESYEGTPLNQCQDTPKSQS